MFLKKLVYLLTLTISLIYADESSKFIKVKCIPELGYIRLDTITIREMDTYLTKHNEEAKNTIKCSLPTGVLKLKLSPIIASGRCSYKRGVQLSLSFNDAS